MNKITGLEPEISEYFLEGKNITTKSTGHALWHATEEMGKQESVEIRFIPTETSMKCIGVDYDKVTEMLKFNASVNFGNINFMKKVPSPITILSYLSIFDEPSVKAEATSKFICRKNPIFEIKTCVKRDKKEPEYSSFLIPSSIPMNEEGISRAEDAFWNSVFEIKFLNSLIPTARSKEELLGMISGLKENIEKANIAYLDMIKTGFDFPLCRQINMI